MRVAINVEQLLSPSPGGVGRYTARLATHLQALGVEVLPVVARHSRPEIEAAWREFGLDRLPRPRRLALPRPLLYDAWHLLSWPSMAAGEPRPDILHAPSLAVPPNAGLPLVVSVHDAGPWRYPGAFTARGRWFHRSGMRAALRRADLVLTGTRAAADELGELAGVPAGRTRIVPYGVDPFDPPETAERDTVLGRFGLGGVPYVLWVGSLEPRKGVGTLVAAMASLVGAARPDRASAPGPVLVLAGFPGWQNTGIVAPEHVEALGPRLRRLGRVSDDELRCLYAGATTFAFPSKHEGFGLPVLEAMAAGTPVVAADIPAVREVAAGAAVLVPPEDIGAWAEALGDLLSSPARRTELEESGRHRAALFSWEATAVGTLAIYRELVR